MAPCLLVGSRWACWPRQVSQATWRGFRGSIGPNPYFDAGGAEATERSEDRRGQRWTWIWKARAAALLRAKGSLGALNFASKFSSQLPADLLTF